MAFQEQERDPEAFLRSIFNSLWPQSFSRADSTHSIPELKSSFSLVWNVGKQLVHSKEPDESYSSHERRCDLSGRRQQPVGPEIHTD